MTDWSDDPAVAREFSRLTDAVKELTNRFDGLDEKYVPRREQVLRAQAVDGRLKDHDKALTALDAAFERHQQQHAQTWRSWVQPTVLSLIASGIAVALSQIIGG